MRTFYEILRKLPAVLAGCLANWVKDIFLLKELMSLPDNDIQAMVCFFETNGSFFKVGDANFESLYFEDVIEIINRLKATVAFMNKIESPEIDYERMISLTLYLHLSQKISIELSTLPRLYVSYKHLWILLTCLCPVLYDDYIKLMDSRRPFKRIRIQFVILSMAHMNWILKNITMSFQKIYMKIDIRGI